MVELGRESASVAMLSAWVRPSIIVADAGLVAVVNVDGREMDGPAWTGDWRATRGLMLELSGCESWRATAAALPRAAGT